MAIGEEINGHEEFSVRMRHWAISRKRGAEKQTKAKTKRPRRQKGERGNTADAPSKEKDGGGELHGVRLGKCARGQVN